MGVVIRQRTGAWWVFMNHQGRRKAKRVGTGPSGKKAAEHAAAQFQAQLTLGDTSRLPCKCNFHGSWCYRAA